MGKLMDLTGRRFGLLTVLGRGKVVRSVYGTRVHWLCVCDCGGASEPSGSSLGRKVRSCGCLQRQSVMARNTTHGLSRLHPREYRSWKDMRARCNSPTDTDYSDYGGRGISVCERWNSFASFLADMGERPRGLTLDRIEVNGDYDPSNCRWATATTQANNKRSNVRLSMGNETKTLMEWCRLFGTDRTKVRYRLSKGWSLEDALRTDIDGRKHPVSRCNGVSVSA